MQYIMALFFGVAISGLSVDEMEKRYEPEKHEGMTATQLYNRAVNYQTGDTVEPDIHQALYWYEEAAKVGDSVAQFNLGVFYESGEGVEKNYGKALHWYEKAANQGMPEAQYNLALMHYLGNGTKQDLILSHKWFGKAAESNYRDAAKNRDLIAGHLKNK